MITHFTSSVHYKIYRECTHEICVYSNKHSSVLNTWQTSGLHSEINNKQTREGLSAQDKALIKNHTIAVSQMQTR